MSKYVIITDSSADFSKEMAEGLQVVVLPLSLEVDGKTYVEYVDNREIKPQEFYQKLREGVVASTSQINVAQFTDAFKQYLEQGLDVLHISFSSGLSGTHNSSCIAASDLQALYPDRKIVSLDSLAASLGQGLLVHYLAKMRDNGATIDELIAWHEENKLSLAHWFTVDDLNFLKRGGRLSGAAAFFGTVLNVKPVLHVDNDGHLIAMEKVRGRKTSLDALVKHMREDYIKDKNETVFISHGDCIDDANYVADCVKKEFGITDVKINYVGGVIGSHSGPGTVALFYIGKKR